MPRLPSLPSVAFVVSLFVFSLGTSSASAFTPPPPVITAPAASTGSYTVSFGNTGSAEDVYTLQENGVTLFENGHIGARTLNKSSSGTYSYRARHCLSFSPDDCASGSVQWSAWSAVAEVDVYIQPSGRPSIGCTGCATPDLDGDYTITWTQPAGTVTHFRLFERYDGGPFQRIDLSGTQLSRSFTDRLPGVYEYQVDACNTLVNGNCSVDDSAIMQVTVGEDVCAPPVIGWPDGGVAAFPHVGHDRIEVQYHDQCAVDQSTKVYGRAGLTGTFQLLRTDPGPAGGWRRYSWGGRLVDTTYCFRVEVTDNEGVVRPSGVRCATTAPSSTTQCDVPHILDVIPGARSIGVTLEDRCPNVDQTKLETYDWPSGTASGTLVGQATVTPAHVDGARTRIVSSLDPLRRYCFKVTTSASGGVLRTSAPVCGRPVPDSFGDVTKQRVLQDVGTLAYGPQASEGILFRPGETRRWNFSSRDQSGTCRSVVVRNAQGRHVGHASGCAGLDVPLTEGQAYHVYLAGGVPSGAGPAVCTLRIDGAYSATEECGWAMIEMGGLVAGDRIQAVHLPPTGLLPAAPYKADVPPTVALVVLPETGVTTLLKSRGNFVANGAEIAVPANVSAAVVLAGFSPNSGQAQVALSQPLRVLVNDVARGDADADGLGNALEGELGTCANGSGNAGAVACANLADPRDSDGDGIGDGWEVVGRRKPAGMSGADLPLAYWGADPRHKDIFAEIDYAHRRPTDVDAPKKTAVDALRLANTIMNFGFTANPVRRASNAADLMNPDGLPGIRMHFDSGVAAETAADWTIHGDWSGWDAYPPEAVPTDSNGDGSLDSISYVSEEAITLWDSMDEVRYGVFRHITTFGWDADGGTADWGLSQNIAIAANDGTPLEKSRVADLITHELGHTLGFGHGSANRVDLHYKAGYDAERGGGRNCKPLWYSIMNYAFEEQFDQPVHGFADGYSYNQRGMSPRSLVETDALDYYVPNSLPETRALFLKALIQKYWFKVDQISGSVDWNRNGRFDAEPVAATISVQPRTSCEQGRVNIRDGLSLGGGWEASEVPDSLSASRTGDLIHLLYTDSENRVRWKTVSYDDDCPSSDPDMCSAQYPASGNDPVLMQQAQGVDIAVFADDAGGEFLVAAAVGEDGAITLRTRSETSIPGSAAQWGEADVLATAGAAGEPELVATPGNGSGRLGVLFYKDAAGFVYMRRLSGSPGDLRADSPQLVIGRRSNQSSQPVAVEPATASIGAHYAYTHTSSPSQLQSTSATKGIQLFVPTAGRVWALRGEVGGGAEFQYVDDIATDTLSEGAKPVPVWVNTEAGNDRSGRLYLYYGQGVAKYARSIERGSLVGGVYSTAWDTVQWGPIDPGSASGTRLAAAVNPDDVEAKVFIAVTSAIDEQGNRTLQMRPRPENVEHFEYQGYNDWLTLGYTICLQTAGAFGKVPNDAARIRCRPLPDHEPSPRLQ